MLTFNHKEQAVEKAFGLESVESGKEIIGRIIFETIKAHLSIEELVKLEEKLPANLTTKTGVLEAVLKGVQSESEKAYALYSFTIYHEKVKYIRTEYEKITDKGRMDHFKDKVFNDPNVKDLIQNLGLDGDIDDILRDKLELFEAVKLKEFKGYLRLQRQVENSGYDFALFKAIIDSDFEYIVDIIDDTVKEL
jgi:hypothetical protein